MTTATVEKPVTRRVPEPHHGVKTPQVIATINAVAGEATLRLPDNRS